MVTKPIATKDLVFANMKVNAAECLMLVLIATVLMFSSQCVASTTCDANPCKNEGTCDDSSGTAVCTCAPGWDGDTCDEVSCTNNPCLNEGTCKVESNAIDCTCAPGWGGDRCAEVSCNNNPCLNEGTCAVLTGSIDCTCVTGYGGERCELAPKCTDSTACENGGTCQADTTDQHICFCAPGFGGDLCADASGAATISGHFLLLTVVAVLAKLNLN